MYDRLDKAYPGSKFILTLRDEQEWIESVRNHWDYNTNPFRAAWDSDPFTHILHKKIYGTTEFNPEVFAARYRRHNSEVIQYFSSRPDDLLVTRNGWEDLCRFLKKPVPHTPYPKNNITRKKK
jgi:hypothetical protein